MPKSDKRQNNKNNKDENSTLRKVIMIIVIIIIILLLITSCSSIFFGKIGNFFDGTSDYDIEDDNNTLEKVYNKDLKFIKSNGETLLDEIYKIEFITSNLDTNDYKCSTSDASIATCVVKDNYIIVYPKKEGKVTITVTTKLNGKEYIATHNLTITSPKRNIQLSSDAGSINLAEYSILEIPYNLNNLAGTVKVTSSNDKIATATAKNGILTITGHKTGKVTITLTVDYQGQKYITTYDLTVTNNKNIKPNNTGGKYNGSSGNKNPGGSYSNNGGSTGSGNQGGSSSGDVTPSKSNVKTLDYIRPSIGNLTPEFNKEKDKYTLENVPAGTNNIKLDIKTTSSKARVYYYVNNGSVPNLDFNNITLNPDQDTPIKIVVEAEDGSTKTYNITVKHTNAPVLSSIATLNSLTITPGGETLNPTFTSNNTKYEAVVNNDVNQITITGIPTDGNATVYINGSTTNNVVNLNTGKNEVEVKVVAEDGKTEKIYKIDITRKEQNTPVSDVNTLDGIKVTDGTQNFNLTPNFISTTEKYSTKVNHNTSSIGLVINKTDITSTIKYQYKNGTEITDISNIALEEGENVIQIIVTSEAGSSKTYEVTINRPKRTIVLDKTITEIAIDESLIGNATTDIPFTIFEDGAQIDSYAKNDIAVELIDSEGNTFKGSIDVTIGKNGTSSKISITPSTEDVNKKFKLTATYLGNKTDTINELTIKTTMTYYIKPNNDGPYNFRVDSAVKNNIIVNTNLFNNGNISFENIQDGVKVYNEKGYINIISSNPEVLKVAFDMEANKDPKSYINFLVEAVNTGYAEITVTGCIYNQEIDPVVIKAEVSNKYTLTIDANGGFFNSFEGTYKELLDADTIINLANYIAHKIDEEENCKYYELDSYNTAPDGTGTRYEIDSTIDGSTMTSNLTLYAIYKETSEVVDVQKEGMMYLTEVDLFRNEEYYKKYKKDKIIYPGANGSHTAYIKNDTKNTININNINVTEFTTCVDEGCINMGYIIKYTKRSDDTWKYFYGGNNNKFSILNTDKEVTRGNVLDTDSRVQNSIILPNTSSSNKESIELAPGEEVAISILWKWVEIDDTSDKLDTKIGSITGDQNYSLMIGFKYTTKDSYCKTGN